MGSFVITFSNGKATISPARQEPPAPEDIIKAGDFELTVGKIYGGAEQQATLPPGFRWSSDKFGLDPSLKYANRRLERIASNSGAGVSNV